MQQKGRALGDLMIRLFDERLAPPRRGLAQTQRQPARQSHCLNAPVRLPNRAGPDCARRDRRLSCPRRDALWFWTSVRQICGYLGRCRRATSTSSFRQLADHAGARLLAPSPRHVVSGWSDCGVFLSRSIRHRVDSARGDPTATRRRRARLCFGFGMVCSAVTASFAGFSSGNG